MMEDFYEELAVILEEEVVRRDDVLEDFEEWDSLTSLAIVAMLSEKYGVEVRGGDLETIVSAGDLEDLVQARLSAGE